VKNSIKHGLTKECSKLLGQSQINGDNLNNGKCKTSRTFKNKIRGYVKKKKNKINEIETGSKNKHNEG
jgi:hypothetical protein